MVVSPRYPAAGSWFTPNGVTATAPAAGQPSGGTRPRFYTTQSGPVTLPQDWSDDEARQWVTAYDAAIATQTQALQQTAGIQRRQIEAQIRDLEEGRKNAMAIATLQAETSRYGVDANREVQLEQLKQRQVEFDRTHALDLQKHGLDIERLGLDRERVGIDRSRLGLEHARTATEYLATPDRHFRSANYLNMAGRVLSDQPGVAPYGAVGTPTQKTEGEYAALAGYMFPGGQAAPSGQAQPRSGYPDMAASAAGGGAGSDARLKALKAVFDASPPSPGTGYDANDFAALNAARAIYGMNLTPRQQATLNADPTNLAINRDAGRTLGYDPESWEARQRASLPGQGSTRAA